MNARLEVVPPDPGLVAGLLAKMADENEDQWPLERERSRHFRDGEAFVEAARRYICGYPPDGEQSESQARAMEIIETLERMFLGAPSVAMLPDLRRARDALAGPRTLIEQRVGAMELVARCASSLELPLNDPSVRFFNTTVAKALVCNLTNEDPAFGLLDQAVDDIIPVLAEYDSKPQGKAGAKGSASILAALILEVNGALGIPVDIGADDASEIERIRKRLQSDFDKHVKSTKAADK